MVRSSWRPAGRDRGSEQEDAVALAAHLGKALVRADPGVRSEVEAELRNFETRLSTLLSRSGRVGATVASLPRSTNGPVACHSMWKVSVAGVLFGPKSRSSARVLALTEYEDLCIRRRRFGSFLPDIDNRETPNGIAT